MALQLTINSLLEGTAFFLFSGNSKICAEYTKDTQEILLLLKTPVSMSQSFMWGIIKEASHSSFIAVFKLPVIGGRLDQLNVS